MAHDFVFDFCPFQGVYQRRMEKGKALANSQTALGYWKDYTLGIDRIVMNYGGGDPCWNGPERTVRVELRCGERDMITRVRENGKCLYEIDFETPSACRRSDLKVDHLPAQIPVLDFVGGWLASWL